jgi:hypothetical protein
MHWSFQTREQAETFAIILGRMTGDQTRVVSFNAGTWKVERYSGSEWVTA